MLSSAVRRAVPLSRPSFTRYAAAVPTLNVPTGVRFASTDATDSAVTASASVPDAGVVVEEVVTGTMDGPGIISTCMHGLQSIHDLGLPWWATVAIGSLGVRAIAAPLFYSSICNGARMQQHQPQLKVFQDKMKEASADKRQDLMLSIRKEQVAYMKEHNIKLSRMFMPLLVQAPLFITFVLTLRRFADESALIDGFQTEGALWFTALHEKDPTFMLPIITTVLTVGAVRINNGIKSNQYFTRDQMRRGMYGLTTLFFPIAAFLPSVMTEYFAITAGTVFLQQATLHSPAVRSFLGLPKDWPNVGPPPERVGTHPLARFLGPPGEEPRPPVSTVGPASSAPRVIEGTVVGEEGSPATTRNTGTAAPTTVAKGKAKVKKGSSRRRSPKSRRNK